jgi:hypothetical protein
MKTLSSLPQTSRVSYRRRLVVRLGFVLLALATGTACIFEQSDYKGGGRLGRAATAQQEGQEEPPPEDTSPPPTSSSSPPIDAGAPGS